MLIAARRGSPRRHEIESLCRRHGVTVSGAATAELDALAPGLHNGFVARLHEASPSERLGDDSLVVLAEDIEDPRNLGALLRVCEATGVGRVLLRDRGSAPLSAVAVKAAAGATEWLDTERITNTAHALATLRHDGFWIYGSDQRGRSPWEVELTGKVVLCIGGEARGLRARTRALCDQLLGLPMRGHIESLNLATAASALLYEAVRQRLAKEQAREQK